MHIVPIRYYYYIGGQLYKPLNLNDEFKNFVYVSISAIVFSFSGPADVYRVFTSTARGCPEREHQHKLIKQQGWLHAGADAELRERGQAHAG